MTQASKRCPRCGGTSLPCNWCARNPILPLNLSDEKRKIYEDHSPAQEAQYLGKSSRTRREDGEGQPGASSPVQEVQPKAPKKRGLRRSAGDGTFP